MLLGIGKSDKKKILALSIVTLFHMFSQTLQTLPLISLSFCDFFRWLISRISDKAQQ